MHIQFALPQTEFKCERRNQCALNSVLVFCVKGPYTLPTGNNFGWVCPQREIIEQRVNGYSLLLRLLYMAQACNLLVSSSVKMNVSLPINLWRFL